MTDRQPILAADQLEELDGTFDQSQTKGSEDTVEVDQTKTRELPPPYSEVDPVTTNVPKQVPANELP